MNDFFAKLYELLHKEGTFSDDLYQEHLYSPLGIIALVSGAFFAILFYYIINRPSFARWYNWLTVMLVCFGINYALGVIIPKNKFTSLNLSYSSEYWVFAIYHALLGCILYTIVSFIIRWWSRNCKGTPIPN